MARDDVRCHKPGLPASSWDPRKGQRQVMELTCQGPGGHHHCGEPDLQMDG